MRQAAGITSTARLIAGLGAVRPDLATVGPDTGHVGPVMHRIRLATLVTPAPVIAIAVRRSMPWIVWGEGGLGHRRTEYGAKPDRVALGRAGQTTVRDRPPRRGARPSLETLATATYPGLTWEATGRPGGLSDQNLGMWKGPGHPGP